MNSAKTRLQIAHLDDVRIGCVVVFVGRFHAAAGLLDAARRRGRRQCVRRLRRAGELRGDAERRRRRFVAVARDAQLLAFRTAAVHG